MQPFLEEISEEVFLKRPVLREISEKYSDISLKDYVQKYWEVPNSPPDAAFVAVLKLEFERLYGQAVAEKAAAQILKKPLVSTIEHLGIWNHPIFVNSDLIYSLHFGKDELATVLATESVSLNNTSSWSASLLWHNTASALERVSFLPDRLKNLPVFSAPAILPVDIKRLENKTHVRFGKLLETLGLERASAKNFSSQACVASYNFWQAVFPSAPKLLYLPLETIISKYLLKVFEDPKDILSQIALTKAGRQLWAKHFGKETTFMFWAIDKRGERQAIKALPQDRQEFLGLVKERKLYASSPLCFIVLLKAGLAAAGGFTQTTWLSEIKGKFVNLLLEMKLGENQISQIQSVATKNFAESSLAWLGLANGYIAPSAVDLYLTGMDYYPKYLKLAALLTLGQSLKLGMPTIYSVVVPKLEQSKFNMDKGQKEVFEDLAMEVILSQILI